MKKSVFLMILITVLAWGATLWLDPPAPNMRSLMHEVYYLDGLLAWEAFAGAILLMTQPRVVAGLTGASFPEIGFWHKALGVSAILLSLIHWGTRMIFSPLVEPFATEPVPHIARHAAEGGFSAFWGALRPFAETSGLVLTIAACVLVILAVIPLLKGKYLWMQVHRLLGIVFIALTIHSIRLIETSDLLMPLGILTILVTIVGVICSVTAFLPKKY